MGQLWPLAGYNVNSVVGQVGKNVFYKPAVALAKNEATAGKKDRGVGSLSIY